MSGEFTSGYLQEVNGDLDGPPCHVCGAIMVKTRITDLPAGETSQQWFCESCGTTTGCS